MQVISTTVEPDGPNRIRVTSLIELGDADEEQTPWWELGEGPTGDAIPDRIVQYLITCLPSSASLADIQAVLGGNPGTVNRQAWTLANNAPDLQKRLRGWVMSAERGRYCITPRARQKLQQD